MGEIIFRSYGSGTCINCGFLWQTNPNGTGEGEFEADQRANGRLPSRNRLRCFRNAVNLREKITEAEQEISQNPSRPGGDARSAAIQQVIQEGRNCQQFYAWVPNFGPQWHYNAWREEILEEIRRKNDLEQAKMQQESLAALKQISQDHLDFVKISDKQTARFNQQTSWFNRMFFTLALAALALAIGALAYPSGASWLEWVPGQSSMQTQQSTPDAEATPLQPTS